MATIPLPALHVNPPQPAQDPLENYARLVQLRNQAQMQPLQMQAAQQQVHAGQLENQQREQDLKDKQAMTSAMQGWDGKDYNEILPLVLKNGGSAQAVMGLKSKILEQQQSISTTVKNNGEGAKAQFDAVKTKGDLLDGALSPLIDPNQVPDEKLSQALMATAQDLAQKGVLDPQHAQQAAQLASQPPQQIRQQLDLMRKSNMAQSQILEAGLKQAQTGEANARANEATANTTLATSKNDFYKKTGMPAGVSPEEQGLAAYLQANPGKTAQDFIKWKAQNSPSMILQGMSQGSAIAPGMQAQGGGTDWTKVAQKYGMTAPAFDQTAEKYFNTGNLPQIGRSPNAIAMNRDLMNRAAELHPGASLAENSAEFKANSASLKTLQSNFDQVSAFEGTANKNIEMLKNIASKVPDLGSKFLNVPVRLISGNMIGTENMAAFKTALAPVQAESAKILNSANLSGQLSDSSRHELQGIVDGNLPYPALVASLSTLQQDFKNRHDSISQQIGDIQTRLKGASSSSSAPTSADKIALGAIIIQNGHKYKVTAVDANGKPTSADPL